MPAKLRILAVDDNPADARLLREYLSECLAKDYEIKQAGCIREALALLASSNFDVIFLDLDLPDSRGLGSLEKIAAQKTNAAIIVLTCLNDEETGLQAIKKHAADYLAKGQIDANILAHAIRYAVERKRFENVLALERNNLQMIFDAVNVGLLLVDEKGVVKRINKVISRWMGSGRPASGNSQPGDILGCIHALDNPAGCGRTPHCDTCPIRGAFESVLRSGKPVHGVEAEATLSIAGSQVRLWLDFSIDPVCMGGEKLAVFSINDITEHKRTEAREKDALVVAMSARTAMDTLQAMGEGVLLTDMNGRILSVNPAFKRLSGLTELLGRPLMDIILPMLEEKDRPMALEAYRTALSGESPQLQPLILIVKHGRSIPVIPTVTFIRNSSGKATAVILTVRDISEIRAMQHDLEENNKRLRALAERLSSTEERERRRISTQIHDTVIQTLSLSNIKLGALLKELTDSGAQNGAASVQAVRAIVEDAIRESRSLMAELTPPLLYELGLVPALDDLAQKLSKQHDIPIHVKDDERPKPLDKAVQAILFQTTRELILNALKHAGKCVITVSLARENGRLRICVEDNGSGFAVPEKGRFVFRNNGGFGLFAIRERLEGIDGRLVIRSQAGAGTSASLFAPLAVERS
ncbi:MAG: PAS domain S-box protein [Kiritimatiellia bacterium]|jgi:signal transduction histidine kinase/CheY-like chemotaxis protein